MKTTFNFFGVFISLFLRTIKLNGQTENKIYELVIEESFFFDEIDYA